MTNATITNETAIEGSYVATVTSYGVEFAAHYIAGEIRLYGLSRSRRPAWQTKSSAKHAKAAVAARIAELGPQFAAEHRALYEAAA